MRYLPLILLGAVALVVLGLVGLSGAPLSVGGDDAGRLIYLLVLLGVMTFWWGASRWSWGEVARDFKYLLYWGAILLGLVAVYGLRDDFARVWQGMLAELNPARAVATGEREVMLAAGADGHFRVETEVNGVTVKMIIDTGASDVALTRADARAIGVDVDALTFDRPVETAKGTAMVAPVLLERVRIGGIEVRNVEASVGDAGLTMSLLGMSFLKRLSAVEITPTRLTLRQ